MSYQLVKVNDGSSFLSSLAGYKTYLVGAVAAAKAWFVVVYGHPWSADVDAAINYTLVALGAMALRSGMKTEQNNLSKNIAAAQDKKAG